MNDRNRRNRSRNPNRERDRNKDRDREKDRPQEPRPERILSICALCDKPIKDVYSSIIHKEKGEPVHFDCVMQELMKTEPLGEGERLCYLGSGIFGILKSQPQGGPAGFSIRKKFQYEDKEKAAAWRRSLFTTSN